MKTEIFTFAAALALFTFVACSNSTASSSSLTQIHQAAPAESSKLTSEPEQDVPNASTATLEVNIPFIYVSGDISPSVSVSNDEIGFDWAQIQEELQEIAEQSTAYLGNKRSFETFNEVVFELSQDEKYELLSIVGQMGYVTADSRMDMSNPEQMRTFYRAYEEKKDAQIGVYTFDGGITRVTFLCRNGLVYRAFSRIRWTTGLEPIIEPIDSFFKTEVFLLTEKGYLFYGSNERSDGKRRSVSALRVDPLGEENRRLCREYIDPLSSYASTAVFSTDWDSANLEQLYFNDIFEFLYQKETGLSSDDVFTESFYRDRVYPKAVPATVFEAVITKYFPILPEQLRQATVYDADRQVYAFEVLMHPDASPDWEVVSSTKNTDGSITIVVDGVRPENLTDRVVSNTVAIMPGENGSFQYLSNRLTRFYDEDAEHNFTPFQDYHPRIR